MSSYNSIFFYVHFLFLPFVSTRLHNLLFPPPSFLFSSNSSSSSYSFSYFFNSFFLFCTSSPSSRSLLHLLLLCLLPLVFLDAPLFLFLLFSLFLFDLRSPPCRQHWLVHASIWRDAFLVLRTRWGVSLCQSQWPLLLADHSTASPIHADGRCGHAGVHLTLLSVWVEKQRACCAQLHQNGAGYRVSERMGANVGRIQLPNGEFLRWRESKMRLYKEFEVKIYYVRVYTMYCQNLLRKKRQYKLLKMESGVSQVLVQIVQGNPRRYGRKLSEANHCRLEEQI